jgi:hypothetical protein
MAIDPDLKQVTTWWFIYSTFPSNSCFLSLSFPCLFYVYVYGWVKGMSSVYISWNSQSRQTCRWRSYWFLSIRMFYTKCVSCVHVMMTWILCWYVDVTHYSMQLFDAWNVYFLEDIDTLVLSCVVLRRFSFCQQGTPIFGRLTFLTFPFDLAAVWTVFSGVMIDFHYVSLSLFIVDNFSAQFLSFQLDRVASRWSENTQGFYK